MCLFDRIVQSDRAAHDHLLPPPSIVFFSHYSTAQASMEGGNRRDTGAVGCATTELQGANRKVSAAHFFVLRNNTKYILMLHSLFCIDHHHHHPHRQGHIRPWMRSVLLGVTQWLQGGGASPRCVWSIVVRARFEFVRIVDVRARSKGPGRGPRTGEGSMQLSQCFVFTIKYQQCKLTFFHLLSHTATTVHSIICSSTEGKANTKYRFIKI